MKKIWKSLLAFLLVVVGMTSTVFARVDLNVQVNGSNVSIEGQSDHYSKNVMTETWNGDKKYYIDANKTDSKGNFKFSFKTKENKHFNGKVNVNGELKDFEFTTKKTNDDENPADKPSGGGGSLPNIPKKDKKVSVYIRVEGYDETIVPRTKVKVGVFDLNPYLGKATGSSAKKSKGWDESKFKDPTNAHAIVKILKDNHVKYDLQDYGWSLYMSEIDGDKEFNEGPMSGWMYSVNGKLPAIGCDGKLLKEGDEIVWFYGAYGFDTLLTNLKANKTHVKKGEEISLKLSGLKSEGASGTGKVGDYTQTKEPINGASILVDDEEYKIDGKVVKTNSNGEAKIKFSEEGTYKLTATRYKKKPNGKIDIVKPVPVIIKVGDSSSSSSSSKLINKKKEKVKKEIEEKLNKLQINENQLKVVTKDDSCEFSINESIINKKIDEINDLFIKMEDKYKDVNIKDNKNVFIKVKGNKEKKNIFKLNSSIVNKLKDKNTGIKISFEDSAFKFDTKNVNSVDLNEYVEIEKEKLNNNAYKKSIEDNLKGTKVISMPYNIGVYKVHKDGKKEKISMNNCNASIKVDSNSIKNIRKNSLKINYYDSKNNIWKVLQSKYVKDTNVVEGKFN